MNLLKALTRVVGLAVPSSHSTILTRLSAAIQWLASPADLRAFGLPLAGPDAGPVPSPEVMLRLVDLSEALAQVHAARFAPFPDLEPFIAPPDRF